MKKFDKKFLKNVMGLNDENVKLTMDAQRKFPEILTNDGKGFCLDGRTIWNQLEVKDAFANWIKSNLENADAVKDKDYSVWFKQNAQFTQEEIENMSPQKRSANGITEEYSLTLNIAKEVAMFAGASNRANDKLKANSKLIRKYFIAMESAVKEMQNHLAIRFPEKAGYQEMKVHISASYMAKNPECIDTKDIPYYVFTNEADLLNTCLLGKKAKEIREILELKANETRDNLCIESNKALWEIQMLNSSLIIAGMNIETRKGIILGVCNKKFSSLKNSIRKELSNELIMAN